MYLPICGLLIACYGCSQATRSEYPHDAARAAGFALMHAAWNISDLQKGEGFAPFALIQKAGKQGLLRFESKTSARNAVIGGLKELKKEEKALEYWALAFDGTEHKVNLKSDVMVVQVWSARSTHTLYIFQKYQPFASHGKFKLLGAEEIVLDGKELSGHDAQTIRNDVEAGLNSHPKFELWKKWHS